jgi:hypothetical protein
MANGTMITHSEFIDFNSDDDDLLGEEEDLLSYDALAKVCAKQ